MLLMQAHFSIFRERAQTRSIYLVHFNEDRKHMRFAGVPLPKLRNLLHKPCHVIRAKAFQNKRKP